MDRAAARTSLPLTVDASIRVSAFDVSLSRRRSGLDSLIRFLAQLDIFLCQAGGLQPWTGPGALPLSLDKNLDVGDDFPPNARKARISWIAFVVLPHASA
jgi:hypothetical protein